MSVNWGLTLKRLREEKRLTQAELAEKSSTTRSWISRAEGGGFKTPQEPMLEKLARGLEMKLVDLRREIYGIPQEEKNAPLPVVVIPVLGYINAGIPAPAEQQFVQNTYVEEWRLEGEDPKNLFALIVRGESLKNDSVNNDDIVIVKRTTDIINGRVYVVKLDNQFFARHVHKLNNHLRLTAANGDYKEISADEAEIQGRVLLGYKPPIKL